MQVFCFQMGENDMFGLPEEVNQLNEDPYNVGGQVAWYCYYKDPAIAEQVLKGAFDKCYDSFQPLVNDSFRNYAKVQWNINGKTYPGDVLVTKDLEPIGFCVEVGFGFMVFDKQGSHIPCPRFPDGHEALRELYGLS
jgi:hypothetical protein